MKEVNHFLNNITLIHPNSSTKATLLWREGNLRVLGCGVTRWQLRNCKKTRVKLYHTCVVVCKSHKKLDNNKTNVFLLQIPRKKTQARPWWWGGDHYIYTHYMYIYAPNKYIILYIYTCIYIHTPFIHFHHHFRGDSLGSDFRWARNLTAEMRTSGAVFGDFASEIAISVGKTMDDGKPIGWNMTE